MNDHDASAGAAPASSDATPATRASPGFPGTDLRAEFDRMLDAFGGGLRSAFPWPELAAGWSSASALATDLVEKDDAWELSVELPGVDAADVEVSVSGDRLKISGEKRVETEEGEGARHVSERRYGAFSRSFPVPGDADPDAIEATHRDGVLRLRLPKLAEARDAARRIEIRPG